MADQPTEKEIRKFEASLLKFLSEKPLSLDKIKYITAEFNQQDDGSIEVRTNIAVKTPEYQGIE